MEPWPHGTYHGLSIKSILLWIFRISLDIQIIAPLEWRESFPKFNGDPTLAVTHVVNYMKYASSLDVLHEDVLMKIFVSSLESSQRNWLAHSCNPKSIPSSTKLIEEFLKHYRPATQNLQDTFQELKDVLCREGFPIDEDEEKLEEDPDEVSHVEDPDETFDEDEVLISSLPLDEDIQASASPAHQEKNMMSYNPFENFDDALFHDCGNEESCKENLDEVSFVEGLNETLLSTFPFEEDEVVQSCEEVINAYDTGEIMEQPPDIVDNHIDDFIQVGRRRWDFGRFIFDRDPIYDIEGSPQEKVFKLSSSEDWSSCMYDSDDMVTDLFSPSRMTCHNILRVIFSHPLICTLLRIQICSVRIFSHRAQTLIDTRSWPARGTRGPHYQTKVLSY
jgi:hypothetical protein